MPFLHYRSWSFLFCYRQVCLSNTARILRVRLVHFCWPRNYTPQNLILCLMFILQLANTHTAILRVKFVLRWVGQGMHTPKPNSTILHYSFSLLWKVLDFGMSGPFCARTIVLIFLYCFVTRVVLKSFLASNSGCYKSPSCMHEL